MWGPIGLSIMLAVGPQGFAQFLAGGADMDAHFRTADFAQNLPVLLALVGILAQPDLRLFQAARCCPMTNACRACPHGVVDDGRAARGKDVLARASRAAARAECRAGPRS